MDNDEKKDGDKMNALQEVKTNELAQMIKLAFMQDAEIKAAILNDPKAVERILQATIIDEIKGDFKKQKLVMRFDYEDEKETFISTYKSSCTQTAYCYALDNFQSYCLEHGISTPIAAAATDVDSWLYEQQTAGKAPATIRRNAGAVSAFFAYIERKSNGEIRNPVRGTKARPKNTPTRKSKFYSIGEVDAERLQMIEKDIETIIANERKPELKAILCCMAYRGLRCGAFEEMRIHGESFETKTKGEIAKGKLPASCISAIDAAGLKHNEPFRTWTSNRVKQNVKNHVNKLFEAGKITYKYSAHDLRHYFALCEYSKNHDIYSLSKLLNHAGIGVTEKYLKGLNVRM